MRLMVPPFLKRIFPRQIFKGRKLGKVLQAKILEKLPCCSIDERFSRGLFPPQNLDESSLEEGFDDTIGVNAPDLLYFCLDDGLFVRDDRECLKGWHREFAGTPCAPEFSEPWRIPDIGDHLVSVGYFCDEYAAVSASVIADQIIHDPLDLRLIYISNCLQR